MKDLPSSARSLGEMLATGDLESGWRRENEKELEGSLLR